MEHTPGPWEVDYGVTRVEVHESGGKMVFIVPRDDAYGRPFAETQANTRLLCAAPDLLTALKDVLRIAKAASIGVSGNAERIRKAEAAIAKAHP